MIRSASNLPTMATLVLAFAAAASPAEAQSLSAETALEGIRSAYAAGRDEEVVLLADRAIGEEHASRRRTPALAHFYFFRGSALRRLGRHKEALVALELARKEGLAIPEVHLERALAKTSLGQEEGAMKEYQEAERLLPDDPERRARLRDRWERQGREEPDFAVFVTPEVGYDTNVVGIEKDAPLLAQDVDRESAYWGGTLSIRSYLHRDRGRQVELEFRSHARSYAEESELSFSESTLSATGRYPLADWLDFETRVSWAEAYLLDEGHLRTLRTAAPSFLVHAAEGVRLRLFADRTEADYYAPDLPNEQDRDGVLERGGFTFGIEFAEGWTVGASAVLADYEADGTDFDHRAWTAAVALTMAPLAGLVFSPTASYTRADYDELNSLSGFATERRDRILRLALTVKAQFAEKLWGYIPSFTLAFVDHRSNVEAFDFQRWEPRFEVAVLALSF